MIIPAHNEGHVIARTLTCLAEGLPLGAVEIVVVANGCSDDTALQARAAAPQAVVTEIDRASKPEALRRGESLVTAMPRLYLDADVELTGRSARATLAALSGGAVAARPPLLYDTAGATWPVRRYYRARAAMPSLLGHAWGAGVIGLSDEARSRFDEFPDVLGDDLFVDSLLRPGELRIVATDPVRVRTPRSSRMLLRILARAQRTKAERPGPAPDGSRGSTGRAAARDLWGVVSRGPNGVLDATVYAAFALAARGAARRGRDAGARWERDESSRAT